MKAISAREPGGPEVLELVELPDLEAGPGELLVRVHATAVNRADILQRRGLYPPPPGASELLGLEMAGTVERAGDGVDGWAPGDPVCAVLAGGGYAEQVLVPAACAMPPPPGLDLLSAAAVPEVFTTAWDMVFTRGRLAAGETVLVHGGSSGVGTATIQLGRWRGCTVLVTAGSEAKLEACRELGADGGIDYRQREDFDEAVRELTGGRGADVVLDMVGGPYLERNLRCLALEGRLVIVGLMGGATAQANLALIMQQRLTITAATLRARSVDAKAALARQMVAEVWPGFAEGALRPVIDRVLPLAHAAQAHALMESSEHVGKIVLAV